MKSSWVNCLFWSITTTPTAQSEIMRGEFTMDWFSLVCQMYPWSVTAVGTGDEAIKNLVLFAWAEEVTRSNQTYCKLHWIQHILLMPYLSGLPTGKQLSVIRDAIKFPVSVSKLSLYVNTFAVRYRLSAELQCLVCALPTCPVDTW